MKFSIVVPTYNQYYYLRESLTSIVVQSFTDYEVVVVDDNSTDDSNNLIREFCRKDPRFRNIRNRTNVGQGQSRNIGADQSRGEYLLFLDSDDWIERNLLQELNRKIAEFRYDLIFFDYFKVYDDGEKILERGPVFDDACLRERLSAVTSLLGYFSVPWNKAYRRQFYQTNSLTYPEGSYEDIVCSYQALLLSESRGVIREPLYNYRHRPGTVRTKPNIKPNSVNHDDVFKRFKQIFDYLQDRNEPDSIRAEIFRMMMHRYAGLLCVRVTSNRCEFFSKCCGHVDKYFVQADRKWHLRDWVIYLLFKFRYMRLMLLGNKLYLTIVKAIK
ncbi:MAG: glycosyltransferase [Gammaproteobacteria bacterium]|nr:glycosyltransferase [Gammaproteobacteria bacterium]